MRVRESSCLQFVRGRDLADESVVVAVLLGVGERLRRAVGHREREVAPEPAGTCDRFSLSGEAVEGGELDIPAIQAVDAVGGVMPSKVRVSAEKPSVGHPPR